MGSVMKGTKSEAFVGADLFVIRYAPVIPRRDCKPSKHFFTIEEKTSDSMVGTSEDVSLPHCSW
jgi:hypothetical protein